MPTSPPGYRIDRDALPDQFITGQLSGEFWEELGRTIGCFGFLEWALGRAIFALTGTKQHPKEKLDNEAFEKWLNKLEHALTDQLHVLANNFGKALREHDQNSLDNVEDLVSAIQRAAITRNMLCHATWNKAENANSAKPYYVAKKRGVCTCEVDVGYLEQLQLHVSDLACEVMDTVTQMGYRFPGSSGPGAPIL